MSERPTSFAQILAPPERTKGKLTYVPEKDFQRCRAPSARGFEKSIYIRPESVNGMGGYYTACTQRVDMLD